MSMRMLFDWLFATLAFALIAWAGATHYGGDPELWRLFFIVATGAFVAGHWNGHNLGRREEDPDRLDRDWQAYAEREPWRG